MSYICHCVEKRTKIKTKEAWIYPFKKDCFHTIVERAKIHIFIISLKEADNIANAPPEIVASDVTILWYAVTIMLGIITGRELLQFGIAPRRYFFSFENWLEVVLIGLTAALLFYSPFDCHIDAKRQVHTYFEKYHSVVYCTVLLYRYTLFRCIEMDYTENTMHRIFS